MNNSDLTYCRFCAEETVDTELVNLQVNHGKRRFIEIQLFRLNVKIDFRDDLMPKTVCFVCKDSLDRAYEFVTGVERSQAILSNKILVQHIKKEVSLSDNENSDEGFITTAPKADNFPSTALNHDDFTSTAPKDDDFRSTAPKDDDSTSTAHNDDEFTFIMNAGNTTKPQEKKATGTSSSHSEATPMEQLKLTWKDYIWTCSYCDTQFQTLDELKVHSMQYHGCCNAFRCTDCNIRKLRLDMFMKHVKRHRKFLQLSCYKCYLIFPSLHETSKHKATHITSKYSCKGCNNMFESSDEMIQHMKLYYLDLKAQNIPDNLSDGLTCLLCKKTYSHKGSLNKHLLIHTERKRDNTCEKCGKSFLNKHILTSHMLLHDDSRPYKCEICKATFKTKTYLRNHVGVHDAKKPYSCDECRKCFRLKKQLDSHKLVHTDLMPHVCTYCNKGFRLRTTLKQHILQHTGVKPYSCQVCQRDFSNWPNCNKHMKRRHGRTMATKKHTPDGVFPINPVTGEIIIHPETNETVEWKKKIMMGTKPSHHPKAKLMPEETSINLSKESEAGKS